LDVEGPDRQRLDRGNVEERGGRKVEEVGVRG
jgi:hypothetical protein